MKYWTTILIGLEKKWLLPKDMFKFLNHENFLCSDDDLANLYMAYDHSIKELLKIVKHNAIIYGELNSNLKDLDFDLLSFDPKYLAYWEYIFLKSISNSSKTIKEKLNEVSILFTDFDYKEEWKSFIYYMPAETKDQILGDEYVYSQLLKYIRALESNYL